MTLNGSNRKKYAAIILAAGLSTRMGSPKIGLRFNEHHNFVSHITNSYANYGCTEIIVVVNKETEPILRQQLNQLPPIKVVINTHPEWQKFYSLKLAVEALEKLQPTFIQNIDNPFTNPSVLDKLTVALQQADYSLPTFKNRGGHPFLVSERILKRILEEPDHEIHLKNFLQSFDTLRIPVNDENILANINSPEQYKLHFPS